ncbi:MAG: prepilin-type N-terminal cleavage/methylation domain-containing protein [Candidatus Pacebacteria bacterium]|nr:prepilin-type N-terminal cleavage/methylation domain-containing protein [Candidatus Paceibacterota bacterium]
MIFNKKGFTLIELLVVIAIIGILASIVLVSFPTATKKAKDSRIVSALAQTRVLMETLYANQASYAGFAVSPTPNPSEMGSLGTEVSNNGGTLQVAVQTGNAAACAYSGLNDGKSGTTFTKWYCVDSAGHAGFTTVSPDADTYCRPTATGGVCPTVTG